jgi:hypothetical protein
MASLYALYAASTSTHKLPYSKTFEKVKVFELYTIDSGVEVLQTEYAINILRSRLCGGTLNPAARIKGRW